jgi:hypothetical protein
MIAMSHLRVLICRVDDNDDMTELASADLPTPRVHWSAMPLDTLEATVATLGQRLLARLCELQWEQIDAQAATGVLRASARCGVRRRL